MDLSELISNEEPSEEAIKKAKHIQYLEENNIQL